MPSDETALNKVLAILPEITYRKMMGEYLLYKDKVLFGGIYDNRLLLKHTKVSAAMLPDHPIAEPYPGGKGMILFPEPYDAELLGDVVDSMCREMKERK